MAANKLKVYCETTVISDLTSRPSPLVKNLARQMMTREWWEWLLTDGSFMFRNLLLLSAFAETQKRLNDDRHFCLH